MTEPGAMEPFETQFADRVRAYTDVATDRRINALEVSRTAMSSPHVTRWRGWRSPGLGWAGAIVGVVAVGIVAVALQGRPSNTAGGPVPDVIRHSWQRPMAVDPDSIQYGSAFLSLVSGQIEFGREPGPGASKSAIAAAGIDTFAVTATAETLGCAIGDIGTYRWSLAGKDTVMTLATIGADPCAAREQALAGPWVRADLPPPANPEATLPAGTHLTTRFNPFGDEALPGRLSLTVPGGWKVKEDEVTTFLLHRLPDTAQSHPTTDTFVQLLAQPRMVANFSAGASCDSIGGPAPGVGSGIDDIVAAIVARPGVVSAPPAVVSIGGYEGRMLDLQLAPSWTGGCGSPDGLKVFVPLLEGSAPKAGPIIIVDQPVRLILLDLRGGRTLVVAIYALGPSQPSALGEQLADVMPVVESFEFHPPSP